MSHQILFLLTAFSLILTGCAHKNAGGGAPPKVPCNRPLEREVTDYAEYPGRTAAVKWINVIPRVTGYLVKIPFKEGSEVKKGDTLFEIDPRPYQALVDQAKAQVAFNEAQLKIAQANYDRDRKAGTAVTPQQLDIDLATVNQNAASLKAAQATLDSNQINLDFTKVTAPIDGRVSNYYLTLGNLAVQDQSLLTTVVAQDPMYAYFDVDEGTVLNVRELIRQGKFRSLREAGVHVPVYLGLANDQDYPHEGYLDFANNQFTATTATLRIRGIFENPPLSQGDRLISPGMFVHVRVPVTAPYQALLVSQAAIGTDQDVNFVFTVNGDNQIERHNVELGTLHDNLQAIKKGIGPDDRVVSEGLQHLKPGMIVQPVDGKQGDKGTRRQGDKETEGSAPRP